MRRIQMGNDEFILYIRKNHDCRLTNEPLGRRIWIWIRDHANGRKTDKDQLCRWGSVGDHIGEHRLPKTATQFEFDATSVPDLYLFLDQIARENPTTP